MRTVLIALLITLARAVADADDAASTDGEAIDVGSANVRWSTIVSGNGRVAMPLVVESGLLLSPTDRGRVSALDAVTGAVRWTAAVVFRCAAIDRGRAIVATANGVSALDGATGAPVWTTDLRNAGVLAPNGVVAHLAVVTGRVIAVTADRCCCLDGDHGRLLWTTPATVGERGGPVVDGDLVVVPEAGGGVAAVEASSGAQRWRTAIPGLGDGDAVLAGHLVIVVDSPEGGACQAVALTTRDGAIAWRRTIPGEEWAAARACAGGVIAISGGRHVSAVSLDGRLLWQREEDRVKVSADGADAFLVARRDGSLATIGAQSGEGRSTLDLGKLPQAARAKTVSTWFDDRGCEHWQQGDSSGVDLVPTRPARATRATASIGGAAAPLVRGNHCFVVTGSGFALCLEHVPRSR